MNYRYSLGNLIPFKTTEVVVLVQTSEIHSSRENLDVWRFYTPTVPCQEFGEICCKQQLHRILKY